MNDTKGLLSDMDLKMVIIALEEKRAHTPSYHIYYRSIVNSLKAFQEYRRTRIYDAFLGGSDVSSIARKWDICEEQVRIIINHYRNVR